MFDVRSDNMYIPIGVVVVFLIIFKIYQKLTCRVCDYKLRLNGKVAIVTGANTGIGYETAKDFARRGAKVILACRNDYKASEACANIIRQTGNRNVIYKRLDLASLASVRSFADDILRTEPSVHILVNNAGVGTVKTGTEDGYGRTFQVNYLGPFLLTNLLLPVLKSSAPSRIVNVSSLMHRFGSINLTTMHLKSLNFWESLRLYSNSKLCINLFTMELSRQLYGSGVVANCVHPGAVYTDIFRNQPAVAQLFTKLFLKHFFKSPCEGAQTSIYVAVAPELMEVSGKYFVDCKESKSSAKSCDSAFAVKLWEVTERLVQLE